MTYEKGLFAQADPGIVSGSTIERKKMSTKTIYKRIAFVAVTALGAGVLSVAPASAAAGDFTSAADSATLYTSAGVAVTTPVSIDGTDDDSTLGASTVTATMTTKPTGSTAAATWNSTAIESPFAIAAASNKHLVTYDGNVATIAQDTDATGVDIVTGAPKNVGTLSFTPDAAGKYVITLTQGGVLAAGTEANGTITIWASGANGTVGTAGTGTRALTAQVGGQAQFVYTTPNGTATGTIYQIQSAGVGSIIGATGLLTDGSTPENPVPYNGTAGDFSAGAKWTTTTNATPHQGTFVLQSSTAGTQTVSITKIDAATGSPVAVTSVTVSWAAATSLNLTTLQVSILPGDDSANCTVANKANVAHNSVTRVPATDQTNSAAADADICVIAMNGNGTAKALTSLTIGTAGPGLVAIQDIGAAGATTYGLASVSSDVDGQAQFNTAGSLISGNTTYLVSAKALNADGTTYTTLTGTVSVAFVDSAVAKATLTQLKYALDDGAVATAVANFVLEDKSKLAMAGGATSNLLVDSDRASTLVVDAAGESDAAAAVTVSTATSVAATGIVTKGVISVDCAATSFEKLTIWMHFEANTVPSNKITVYCTNDTVKTLVIGAVNSTAGSSQKITATATAGITGKPDYPTADSATATFSALIGTLSSTSAVNFVNGVATVNYASPSAAGTATINVVPSDVTTVAAFALGVEKAITITASSDITAITTLINSLIAKINALNKLVVKIQKKVNQR